MRLIVAKWQATIASATTAPSSAISPSPDSKACRVSARQAKARWSLAANSREISAYRSQQRWSNRVPGSAARARTASAPCFRR